MESPNASLSCPAFQIRDMNLVHPGVFSQIYLPPTLSPPQLADAATEQDTNVCCHRAMVGVGFMADLAHTLFGSEFTELAKRRLAWLFVAMLQCLQRLTSGPSDLFGSKPSG